MISTRKLGGAKSFVAVLVLAGLILSLFVSGAPRASSGSRYSFKRTEKCLMRKINRHRARRDLHRLRRDRQLGYVGRRHARRMARGTSVDHHSHLASAITRWNRLAQNVGRARSCWRLFRALWRSPLHRQNILGRYRFVGVGTKRRKGRLYAIQIFESRRNPGNHLSYP